MKRKRQGFTLVELIIVIAILGILAAIAIPKYNKSRLQAAVTAHKANVEMLKSAARMKILDADEDFEWPKENDTNKGYEDYIEKWPEVPNGLKTTDKSAYKVTYSHNTKKLTVTPDEKAFDEILKDKSKTGNGSN